jgi:hypothetical protein
MLPSPILVPALSKVNSNQRALKSLADYFISNNTITMNGSDKVDCRVSHNRKALYLPCYRGLGRSSNRRLPPHFIDDELSLCCLSPHWLILKWARPLVDLAKGRNGKAKQ